MNETRCWNKLAIHTSSRIMHVMMDKRDSKVLSLFDRSYNVHYKNN